MVTSQPAWGDRVAAVARSRVRAGSRGPRIRVSPGRFAVPCRVARGAVTSGSAIRPPAPPGGASPATWPGAAAWVPATARIAVIAVIVAVAVIVAAGGVVGGVVGAAAGLAARVPVIPVGLVVFVVLVG